MPGFYVRLTPEEVEDVRKEGIKDRRAAQDEAAILIAEALRHRRAADDGCTDAPALAATH